MERTQATLGKSQLQQEKIQNSLDVAQRDCEHLQEKMEKATNEIRRVSVTMIGNWFHVGNVSGLRNKFSWKFLENFLIFFFKLLKKKVPKILPNL